MAGEEQVLARLTRPVLSPTRCEGSRKEREAWPVTRAALRIRQEGSGRGPAPLIPSPIPGKLKGLEPTA